MKLKRFFSPFSLICWVMLTSPPDLFCQSPADDSFCLKALQNSMTVYHKSFEGQSALYTGSMYYNYPFNFEEGQPYFHSAEMTMGSVVYDAILYDSVIMQYDEVADAVIIQVMPDRIHLRNEKVEGFHLYDADFIRLKNDEQVTGLQQPGFYNLLHAGKISLLKKQIKTIREEVTSHSELLMFVDTRDQYYIKKNNQLYPVSGTKDLYKILGDHKNEVKEFVKVNKLSFRKDRQNMLTRATAYYDSLK